MPEEPEVRGLLALMLFCDARRAARRTPEGRYVPLSEQSPAAWSTESIVEAERELAVAAGLGRVGRFQLEAAIQSVHSERARSGRTDWDAIVVLYEHLVRIAPTLGARVAQAAAVSETRGAATALTLLEALDRAAVAAYQPYWAVRAHLLRHLGRATEAREVLRSCHRSDRGSRHPAVPARPPRPKFTEFLSNSPPLEQSEGRNRHTPGQGG
jgi:predicted RNA polymerase sigma factor